MQLRFTFQRRTLRAAMERRYTLLDARYDRQAAEVDRLERELLTARQAFGHTSRERTTLQLALQRRL